MTAGRVALKPVQFPTQVESRCKTESTWQGTQRTRRNVDSTGSGRGRSGSMEKRLQGDRMKLYFVSVDRELARIEKRIQILDAQLRSI